MDELVKNLMEELNCDTAFTIPIFGGIPVAESVFVTWLIMAVVILLCAIFVRNLKVTTPGKGVRRSNGLTTVTADGFFVRIFSRICLLWLQLQHLYC